MEIATKLIVAVGGLAAIGGLGWAFTGANEYFRGRKNNVAQQMDSGMDGMLYGFGMSAISTGIAAAIVAAINAIQF